MRNIRIIVEYDGTDFSGWQRQPTDPSVQQALEEAIQRVTGSRAVVIGSGRTDAGVHAEGQVANFRTDSALPVERLKHALNYYLPLAVSVLHAAEVSTEFHAQRCAVSKRYRYRILPSEVRRPLRERHALRVRQPLDLVPMQQCVEALPPGPHDFAAFAAEQFRYKSTVRELHRAELVQVGDEIHFTIQANGFLYNMVRSIVGTLIHVGRSKMSPEGFAALLHTRDRDRCGPTAPPHGLCLVAVYYEKPPASSSETA